MPSDDLGRDLAGDVGGSIGLLIFLGMKAALLLFALPYLYGFILALWPILWAINLFSFGVVFIIYGILGLAQFHTGRSDILIETFPQMTANVRIGVYMSLILIIGPTLILAGKRMYRPAKRLTGRSINRLRELYGDHGFYGFVWVVPEVKRLIKKVR